MAQRPSTSGGQPSRKPSHSPTEASRTDLDKRLSKDDSALYLKGKTRGRSKTHNESGWRQRFPAANGDFPHQSSAMASTDFLMLSPQSMSSGEIPIGMALGSPSQAPPVMNSWQSPVTTTRAFAARDFGWREPQDAILSPPVPSPQRSKSKRRLFGGLFGGKKSVDVTTPSPSFSDEASPSGYSVSAGSGPREGTLLPTGPAGRAKPADRVKSIAPSKTPKHKPIIIRSNTEPISSSHYQEPKSLRPNGPFVSDGSNWAIQEERDDAAVDWLQQPTITVSPAPPPKGSLLDVEIPSIKMERYSVMFGGLLGTQPASSLLARRQATLDRLKTIKAETTMTTPAAVAGGGGEAGPVFEKPKVRQRRGTSPGLTKSPIFTLFPPTPRAGNNNQPATPQRLSPLTRSNTSPALLPSPSKATFGHDAKAAANTHGTSKGKKHVTLISPKEAASGRKNHHAAAIESPASQEIVDTQPLRPTIPEPEWQMMPMHSASGSTSTLATGSSVAGSSSSSSSTAASSVTSASSSYTTSGSSRSRSPQAATDTETAAELALKSAVEISIARQISVSYQQRQMLRPLQTSLSSRPRNLTRGPGASPSGSPSVATVSPSLDHIRKGAARAARDVPRSETKTSTPTLVVPGHSADVNLLQHRKSERVILEAA